MCLLSLFMIGFMNAMFATAPGRPPIGAMFFMSAFIFVIYGLMTIPSFVAAYALLKKKSWAKTAAIIGGVTAAMNFPLGTAVCVYTFWFLFSEPGKAIYEKPPFMLPPSRQAWAENMHQRQEKTEYVPPSSPPDWR